jgi:pyrimidine-specific ribonucleoside hydrolase
MKQIIIDCDPGHDDAIAILLALAHSDELTILGITTVGGNQVLDKITDNALKLLSYVGADIPLARGAAGPLMAPLITGEIAHGETGMDGPILPSSLFQALDVHAVEFMASLIRGAEGKVTLIPIGPLTNIALLLTAYPEVKSKIECISLMGGGIGEGNMTSTAEFNIYVDPEAAQIVYRSGIPIVMSGLDVTNRAQIYPEEIEQLKQRGKASILVGELLDFYSIYSRKMGYDGSALHDPCAVAWLLRPDIFHYVDLHVDVETKGELTRGMTVADRRKKPDREPNVRVLIDLDRDAFIRMITEALDALDRQLAAGQ